MATIYDFEAVTKSGKKVQLSDYKGQVVLIVNTASKCGFTPQYEGLEKLYKKYKDKGLVVLGFPCNQFGNQEPDLKTQETCLINFGITFPVFSVIDVNGANEHPLFTFLKSKLRGTLIRRVNWNFTKFLIDKTGIPVKRFSFSTKPEDLEQDILKLLG